MDGYVCLGLCLFNDLPAMVIYNRAFRLVSTFAVIHSFGPSFDRASLAVTFNHGRQRVSGAAKAGKG
jgi:hypothetical protein